jgi:hypothetical protein
MTTSDRLTIIYTKFEKLYEQHKEALAQIAILQADAQSKTEIIEVQKKEIFKIQHDISVLKIAQSVDPNHFGTRDSKLKIDTYIQLVDECLSLLSTQTSTHDH